MYSIGVDLGGTNLRAALVSDQGVVVDKKEISTPTGLEGPKKFIEFIVEATQSFQVAHKDKSILCLGIGSPGPLSRKDGMIHETPNLPGYDGFPVLNNLKQKINIPCFIDNDANCAGFAEWKLGAAQGMSDFFMLTLGTGIGGAIVCNGQMVYGKTDGAGELGHITIYPRGRECKCGKLGCFEQYASATAIKRRAAEKYGEVLHNKDLFERALQKENQALSVLEEVAYDLAVGIGTLLNALDSQAVILGGGIFKSGGEPLLSMVQKHVPTQAFPSYLKDFKILPAYFKSDAGVIGAATMAMHELRVNS